MKKKQHVDQQSRPELTKSTTVEEIPMACANELAAVEFIEARRWKGSPCCVHCKSSNVYKMTDAKTGERNKRFLWRCHDCKKQFTVRIGTVFEESRIGLRHWVYTFWRASTSKKGVAAMEIQRQCQISYKSALFLLHRVRWAMAPANAQTEKLTGIVECDETYVGGKPRPGHGKQGKKHYGRGTSKQPVFGAVQRDGNIKRKVVANVSGPTLKTAIAEMVDTDAKIITDEFPAYNGLIKDYRGHWTVSHSTGEYARGETHTNTIESSFALLKRSITGIHHAVSKKHLHRYVSHMDFLWNNRRVNDGERTDLVIFSAQGKRLMYRQPTAD